MRNNILREDLDAVIRHLQSDDPMLTQGRHVSHFEEAWSKWLGVGHSVFVNSGASANFITIAALKTRFPDGEIIVPALTWISDIASVLHFGFKPVFVDIDPSTLSMDSSQVISKIGPDTCAIFVTHAQGFNGLTDDLLRVIESRGITLIEDVCESHGAQHGARKLGSIGWISNFSFYYAHHMSTIEGGMICTNDPDIYEVVRMMRSHGMVREASNSDVRSRLISSEPLCNPEFIFQYPMFNMRNTEIGGILGLSQLARLDENITARNRNKRYFLSRLNSSIYFTDFQIDGMSNYAFNLVLRHSHTHLVTTLMRRMNESGVEFRRGSAGGGNQLRQPYIRGRVPENYYLNFPVTEHIHSYGFYIGNYPTMTLDEIEEIAGIVNSIAN